MIADLAGYRHGNPRAATLVAAASANPLDSEDPELVAARAGTYPPLRDDAPTLPVADVEAAALTGWVPVDDN